MKQAPAVITSSPASAAPRPGAGLRRPGTGFACGPPPSPYLRWSRPVEDIRTITSRALHDALAIRGLESGQGGFIRTTSPELYMSAERLRLARVAIEHLPANVSTVWSAKLIDQLVPIVSRAMQSTEARVDPTGPIRFLS